MVINLQGSTKQVRKRLKIFFVLFYRGVSPWYEGQQILCNIFRILDNRSEGLTQFAVFPLDLKGVLVLPKHPVFHLLLPQHIIQTLTFSLNCRRPEFTWCQIYLLFKSYIYNKKNMNLFRFWLVKQQLSSLWS